MELGQRIYNTSMSRAEPASSVTIALTQFDQRHYRELIKTRGETIRRVTWELKSSLGLSTALDAGCGIGFFAEILRECGLSVGGFDGREENVQEARKRFPRIPFEYGDVEDPEITSMGKFDLVLCFGLLYHLENPMLAIRHLRTLTRKGLLLESMCVPRSEEAMLLREEPRAADQSLTEIALCPSESCLVKMLYRAGYGGVYRVPTLPDHDDFRETRQHARRRTVLFASPMPVELAGFSQLAEPRAHGDPWATNEPGTGMLSLAYRVQSFLQKPKRAKYIGVAMRAQRLFPELPIPLRLSFGAWWMAERSALDEKLIHENSFEAKELQFVARFLRPGMTVLDVGAHHGLYTLLISKRIGRRGRVIAFEPSPRERKRLVRHLRVNRCSNVTVEPCALGDFTGQADLFVVSKLEDWCNSLRPPATNQSTSKIRVAVRRADDVLEALGTEHVDFVKIDVEGAELSVLKGAIRILRDSRLRPGILAEVQDFRTKAWGYAAREILEFLEQLKYRWFAVTENGKLEAISTNGARYDENLVALPQERLGEFAEMLKD